MASESRTRLEPSVYAARLLASVADSSLSRVTPHVLADAPPICGVSRKHVGRQAFRSASGGSLRASIAAT
jgi:hypothetical protein